MASRASYLYYQDANYALSRAATNGHARYSPKNRGGGFLPRAYVDLRIDASSVVNAICEILHLFVGSHKIVGLESKLVGLREFST